MWTRHCHPLAPPAGWTPLLVDTQIPSRGREIQWQRPFGLCILNLYLLKRNWLDYGSPHFPDKEKRLGTKAISDSPRTESPSGNRKGEGELAPFFPFKLLSYWLDVRDSQSPIIESHQEVSCTLNIIFSLLISNLHFFCPKAFRSMISARLTW